VYDAIAYTPYLNYPNLMDNPLIFNTSIDL